MNREICGGARPAISTGEELGMVNTCHPGYGEKHKIGGCPPGQRLPGKYNDKFIHQYRPEGKKDPKVDIKIKTSVIRETMKLKDKVKSGETCV